ncbi:site-specific integrase [Pseudomonas lurida]|uniref:Site-specific integrase n=1 Tax=Pseudomonas lurida TaxID=244566 RepID=A0ABY9FQX8_9PSED|nr:site-specific integrase [Pseudomonas lurida]WLH05718.1 site-specific integrase [Pseudomonas lurida]
MADNLIQKKGESTWYVRLAVPVDVQKAIGCKVRIQSLKTGLRKVAMDARLPYLTQWKAEFEAARAFRKESREQWRQEIADKSLKFDTLVDSHLLEAVKNPSKPAGGTEHEIMARKEKLDLEIQSFLVDLQALENKGAKGLVRAVRSRLDFDTEVTSDLDNVQFAAALTRRVTVQIAQDRHGLSSSEIAEARAITAEPTCYKPSSPITSFRLNTYRAFRESRGGAAKHVDQQVGKMKRLSAFLKQGGRPINFDTVDEWLKSLNRAPATLGQYLMAGTAFWKWAMKYDAAWREEFKDKVNPFTGHELPKGGGSETAGKDREIYTRADTIKLHQAALNNRDKPLADLIALGWYTGARIEELCRLNKDSVITVDGIRCFDFPKSKSKASKRVVPIHPSLTTTIERLCEETTDTFLIPTSSHDRYGKRSHAISKAFGRLRTAAGFSKLHVFHSFRHTVVTELIRADVPDALAKELVGHETGSVTHDVYSKGASTLQKLAAISKLPSLK